MKYQLSVFIVSLILGFVLSGCAVPSKKGMSNSVYGYGSTQQPQVTQRGIILQSRTIEVKSDSPNVGALVGAGTAAGAAYYATHSWPVIIGGAIVGGYVGDALVGLYTVEAQELVIQMVDSGRFRGTLGGIVTIIQTSPEPLEANQEVFVVTSGHRLNQHVKVVPFYDNPNLNPTFREIRITSLDVDGSPR